MKKLDTKFYKKEKTIFGGIYILKMLLCFMKKDVTDDKRKYENKPRKYEDKPQKYEGDKIYGLYFSLMSKQAHTK